MLRVSNPLFFSLSSFLFVTGQEQSFFEISNILKRFRDLSRLVSQLIRVPKTTAMHTRDFQSAILCVVSPHLFSLLLPSPFLSLPSPSLSPSVVIKSDSTKVNLKESLEVIPKIAECMGLFKNLLLKAIRDNFTHKSLNLIQVLNHKTNKQTNKKHKNKKFI